MLADLDRKKFVSQAALSELLSELKDAPLPGATSRSSIKRARDEKVDITTPLGPLFVKRALATVDGGCLIEIMGRVLLIEVFLTLCFCSLRMPVLSTPMERTKAKIKTVMSSPRSDGMHNGRSVCAALVPLFHLPWLFRFHGSRDE